MRGYGLSSTQLGLFFASTIFEVFAAGLSAPWLARRWGQEATGAIEIAIALLGSVLQVAAADMPGFAPLAIAIALFLLGMGLINPLGTAIALHPYGAQAGLFLRYWAFCRWGVPPPERQLPPHWQ